MRGAPAERAAATAAAESFAQSLRGRDEGDEVEGEEGDKRDEGDEGRIVHGA